MADLVLMGLFAGFVRGGWSTGFVRRLFGLLFVAASFVIGAYLRTPIGAIVGSTFPEMPKQYAYDRVQRGVHGARHGLQPLLANHPLEGCRRGVDCQPTPLSAADPPSQPAFENFGMKR